MRGVYKFLGNVESTNSTAIIEPLGAILGRMMKQAEEVQQDQCGCHCETPCTNCKKGGKP